MYWRDVSDILNFCKKKCCIKFYFADLVSKGVSPAGPADQICKVEFDGLPNRGQADKAFGDIDSDGNSENSERKEPFAYLHRGP